MPSASAIPCGAPARPEESVELLLTGRCGVLLIDMAAVSTQPATLVEQIVEQFPDVVVVVAGRRDDESLLARLISDGLVYRFMHKPLSPKRAGMFLNAAIRSHVERRESRSLAPLLPLMGELRTRIELRKWLFVTAGLALFLVLLAMLLLDDREAPRPASRACGRHAARRRQPAPPRLADPVLSGARAALAAGRYEAPAGRNALDLYAAVLLARPAHPEARAGLDETTARLVAMATSEAQAGNADEARRLVERVLAVDPGHAAARALQARLDRRRLAGSRPSRVPRLAATPAATPHRYCTRRRQRLQRQPSRDRRGAGPPSRASNARDADPGDARPADAARRGSGDRAVVPRDREPWSAAARSARRSPRVTRPRVTSSRRRLPSPSRSPSPSMPIDATGALPDRDLEQLTATEPVYPLAALRDRVEGWVEVDFTVTEAGGVREIEVVAAEPRGVFEAAATAAVGAVALPAARGQWPAGAAALVGDAAVQRRGLSCTCFVPST